MLGIQDRVMVILSAGLLLFASPAVAQNIPAQICEYQLTTATGEPGDAFVAIHGTELEIEVVGARANTLYTVWIDFKNRGTGELAADYPSCHGIPKNPNCDDDPDLDKGALPRGVAPAFETTAGVTAGMGLDENAFITDELGNAVFESELDYELLRPGDSPVVGAELTMQGRNRVGGYWLRQYETAPYPPMLCPDPTDPTSPCPMASLQVVDPQTGLPRLHRATAQGITIVGHNDFITHGHTPGVGGVRGGPGDHFPGFKGDFHCVGP